jgi:2'-phosphotransferase
MVPASSLDQETSENAAPSQEQAEPDSLSSIPESEDPADYLIRANQGHSIKVDTEGLLIPITQEAGNIPETVVHGTDDRAWSLILKSGGLRRMGRNHIHFASGLPTGFKALDSSTDPTTGEKESAPVISGMRKNSSILIYIDINAALATGIKFFVSENGVILTEGNDEGFLSYEFFKRVESRKKDGGVLMSDGKLPEGVVVNLEEWEKEVGDVQKGKRSGRGGRGGRGGGRGGSGGKARAANDAGEASADV